MNNQEGNSSKQSERMNCMEIEKDKKLEEETENKNSYHQQALSEGWVYF